MSNDFSYDQALRRITYLTLALGAMGTVVALFARGPRVSGGFLLGSLISYASLWSWKSLAGGLARSGTVPRRGSAVFLAARYLIAGTIIYAIVKVSGITLGAVFVGLLVSLAAAFLEILYELTVLRL